MKLFTPEAFELLARKVSCNDFDLMMVGDGAGNTLAASAGWQVSVYDRRTKEVSSVHGGVSNGTNNWAELAGYLHVLWMLSCKQPSPLTSLIISDSEITCRCGSGQYARKANQPLWASLEWFEQKGYKFAWRHVPRNSNPLSERADEIAKQIRKLMEAKRV